MQLDTFWLCSVSNMYTILIISNSLWICQTSKHVACVIGWEWDFASFVLQWKPSIASPVDYSHWFFRLKAQMLENITSKTAVFWKENTFYNAFFWLPVNTHIFLEMAICFQHFISSPEYFGYFAQQSNHVVYGTALLPQGRVETFFSTIRFRNSLG